MKRQRKVDEKRQHSLTDFLRNQLHKLLFAGIVLIGLLIVAPFLLYTPSHSKRSTQSYKPSKRRSTTFNMLRRTQAPALPTLAEIAPFQAGWPDSSTLRTYYTKPQHKPEPQRQPVNSSLNSKPDSESE